MSKKDRPCGECKHHDKYSCKKISDIVFIPDTHLACIRFEPKKPTNRDKLNQMSDGAFAFMMTRLILNGCPISGAKTIEDMQACKISTDCTNCLKQLLNQEAKDE